VLVSILALAQYTSLFLLEKQTQLLHSLRSSPLHKGFPRAIASHCVGERSSEPVARLNSEFFRSNRLSMPVSSYLVDFVFWQALYGRWCPAVMSTMSRLMSRCSRDISRDIGVRLMPICAHGVCTDGSYLGGAKEHCDRSRCVLVHSALLPSARNHVSGGAPSRRTRSNLKLL
jgi:hypothetical protein